jgi:hypothetical protein
VRYVSAFFLAALVWLLTMLALGMVVGQAFDGIRGYWDIVPTVGYWGTSLGLAALAFKYSLRHSAQAITQQLSAIDTVPVSEERCPECGTQIPAQKPGDDANDRGSRPPPVTL